MRKSYFCNKLETSIHFLPERIAFCGGYGAHPYIDFQNHSKEKFIKERERIKKQLRNGTIPVECNCCFEYKEKKPLDFLKDIFKKKAKINHIIINHYKQCDCNCIYCSQKIIYEENIQNYELLPFLKQFFESNLIDKKNLRVEFQGGNASCLKEFPEIINFLKQENCQEYFFLVNHIKYLKEIEDIANISQAHVCISIDSGTKETFNKIKQVDAFEKVITNIKELKKKSRAYISLKYIIIKGVNDSIEEVQKFCELAKQTDVNAIYFELDYRDTLLPSLYERDFQVPEHYYKIIDYAQSYAEKNNISFAIMPYTQIVMKRGYA